MAKRGAKNKYEQLVKPYLDQINEQIRKGITEAEIAKALNISVATLNNYKREHAELREALSKNKGADVLQSLVNAGVEAAQGYYKDNITITTSEKGETKTITRTWYPPNPTLHKFYVLNFGKDQGLVNDPLDYELKKAKQELDETMAKAQNWDIDFDKKDDKDD